MMTAPTRDELLCRVRFEFQKAKKGKVEASNLKKTRKAFGKRVQAVAGGLK